MGRKRYHVIADKGDWRVEFEGGDRASGVFGTNAAAVDRGIELARAQELGQLIIHKQGGTIQEERTYGSDPFPPRG
jgi:hypothetical protein